MESNTTQRSRFCDAICFCILFFTVTSWNMGRNSLGNCYYIYRRYICGGWCYGILSDSFKFTIKNNIPDIRGNDDIPSSYMENIWMHLICNLHSNSWANKKENGKFKTSDIRSQVKYRELNYTANLERAESNWLKTD